MNFKSFKLKINFIIVSSIIILQFINYNAMAEQSGTLRLIYCSSAVEIQNAMKNAMPGDRIIVKEGSYIGKWTTGGYYYSSADGTKENPIIIESENSLNRSELIGERSSSGSVLYITGDNWIIKDLKITNGQKGIIIDNGNSNVIDNCEVYGIGQEGVHFRDGSSNNIIKNSKVINTGTAMAEFGEGIYVGSDNGKWSQYRKECDNNIIKNCVIGPNVRAEHVDVKEGATGTIIENCIFDGVGIEGKNYADSFIDVKGNNTIVRNNLGYRNNNQIIVAAFQIHVQVEGWGLNNGFYDNNLYLDDATAYILDNSKGSGKIFSNKRFPDGNEYKGNNTNIDFSLSDVNRDGTINIEDLNIEANYYNLKTKDYIYPCNFDVNKDGIVDIYDLVLIGREI